MEAIQFVYWLQGALELGQQTSLSEAQVKIIQDHLNLVLNKATPQYNVPKMPNIGVGTPRLGIQPPFGDAHMAVC